MTDDKKPPKPDPFAPLPLADLPPVRSKDTSGPIPKATKKTTSGPTKETLPGATPPTITPPAPVSSIPDSSAKPRSKTPSISPVAFAQPAPAPEDVTWTSSGGQRLGGNPPTGGRAAIADLADLGPGGQPTSGAAVSGAPSPTSGQTLSGELDSGPFGPAGGQTGPAADVLGPAGGQTMPAADVLGPAGGQTMPAADVLGPAGGQSASGEQPPDAAAVLASSGPQVWEMPAGLSWSGSAQSGAAEAWTEAPPPPTAEPLLPATYNEDELRDAIGVTPRAEPAGKKTKDKKPPPPRRVDDDDEDDGGRKRTSRKGLFVGALAIVLGGGITAMVLLGKANAEHYYIRCGAEEVVVEQGRSFPPWGSSALDGAEWKPLKIPPETVCQPHETENHAELAGWYFTMLKDFADKQLGARDVTKVDEAEAILKQALLVSRSLGDEDAKNARQEIDRLLGDVVYWRASARLKTAGDSLAEAAKQFDDAAKARPSHFKDAAEWAEHTRAMVEKLRAGPGGVQAVPLAPSPTGERPSAPPGVALPVEPENAGSAEPPAPAPDAGVPGGGVMI